MRKLRNASANRGYACDICDRELFNYPRERICLDCAATLSENSGRVCPKCGRKTLADGVCLSCKSRAPKFTIGISPLVYEGETAGLINRMKNGNRRLAWYVGERMTDALIGRFSALEKCKTDAEKLLILPVPMTKEKERKRGYNQAEELSNVVEITLQKAGYFCEIDRDTLIKRADVAEQKHLDFHARAENVGKAYHVHKRKILKGRTVVLIDDIMTTGATGSAIAEKLLSAGAKAVIFLHTASAPEKK